jgi:hypothetical protein
MDDNEIARTVRDLEGKLDRLDSACHPGANVERAKVLDSLAACYSECERRAA